MREEKKIRPVKFRFYGKCRTTERLREVTVVESGSEQKNLEAAFIVARREIIKPKLVYYP